MEVATNDGGLVEEYEEDLLATGYFICFCTWSGKVPHLDCISKIPSSRRYSGDIQEINRRLNAAFREGLAWERVGRYDKMSVCYQRLFTLFFKVSERKSQSDLQTCIGIA